MKLIAFRSFNFMGLRRASELIIVVMQGFDTAATETQNNRRSPDVNLPR